MATPNILGLRSQSDIDRYASGVTFPIDDATLSPDQRQEITEGVYAETGREIEMFLLRRREQSRFVIALILKADGLPDTPEEISEWLAANGIEELGVSANHWLFFADPERARQVAEAIAHP